MSDVTLNDTVERPHDELRVFSEKIEKLAKLKSIFIDFDRTRAVTAELSNLHRYGAVGTRAGTSAPCLLITGPSGSGKTSILRRYADRFPIAEEDLRDRRRVICEEVPARCNIKNLAQTLLAALGDVKPSAGSLVEMTARITHLTKAHEVEMIILDEFQHFIDRRSEKSGYDAADWLKSLLNKTRCPIVLAGLPIAENILEENVQLSRRCVGRVRIHPFNWRDDDDRNQFRLLLRRVSQHLPFDQRSELEALETARRIYHFAEGLIGRAALLLEVASIMALEDGLNGLNTDILARAVDRFRPIAVARARRADPNEWINPFRVENLPEPMSMRQEIQTRVTRLRRGKRNDTVADALRGS